MLRIAKLTDYAMLILSEMARQPEKVLSTTFLAEKLHLTSTTASKVLKMLAEGDLVVSIRGAEGGYRLGRGADSISVADIIKTMEGGVAMMECCENKHLCGLEAVCTMKDNWLKINNAVYSLLSQYSLKDMLTPFNSQSLLDGVSYG